MKTKRFCYLELALTHEETDELLNGLSAFTLPVSVEKILIRLRQEFDSSPQDLMFSFEAESEELPRQRDMCDEADCENPVWDEDHEGPDGMCRTCHAEFHRTHVFVVGHGPGTGWVSRP